MPCIYYHCCLEGQYGNNNHVQGLIALLYCHELWWNKLQLQKIATLASASF